MKRYFLLSFLAFLLVSCKKNSTEIKQTNNQILKTFNSFKIKGTLENFYPEKVYLNKIIGDSFYEIDSSIIENNNFSFKGIVDFPERFALTYQNYSSASILIIENTSFNVFISSDAINDPLINGSQLNNELNEYKIASKNIFKKIDYLFPQFQKARLENDANELKKIGSEIKNIETDFTKFSYNFIFKHKNSYVSAMILRDLLKSTTVDTLQIKETYKTLSLEVKNSPDAQLVASFLDLH